MSRQDAGVSGEGGQAKANADKSALAVRGSTVMKVARARRPKVLAIPAVEAASAEEVEALAEQLPGPQRMALEMLMKGETIVATANLAGVSRDTIYRWMKKDARFQAAYNQWCNYMNQCCLARMVNITDVAADAMVRAMQAGDGKLGFAFLKARGLLPVATPLPTDPEELAQRLAAEERRRLRRLKLDTMQFGVGGPKATG